VAEVYQHQSEPTPAYYYVHHQNVILLEGNFLAGGGGGLKKKYHLVKWKTICKAKKKGGLGIKELWKMNISLLCK
jgi:hypothetical protein